MPSPRVWIAAVVGSAIEWFDYFLYGTLASLVFGRLFFPASDPLISLSLAYLSFALTFFIRPLGGAFFANIGDRLGRKQTLVITLSLMGGATVLIGLLPSYGQIGLAAPVLLILLRLVQGLGLGGEWGGALLLAYEYAPPNRRGFFAALPQTGPSIGMLLSTLCVSAILLLPEKDLLTWGWRVPFLASALLVGVGLWIRKGIGETPDFQAMKAAHGEARNPLLQTLRQHWRSVLAAIGAKMVETAPFYIFTIFSVSYVTGTLGLARMVALNAVTISACISVLTIPLAGRLCDAMGRQRTFVCGCVAMAIYAPLYFLLLSLKTPAAVTIATVIGMAVIWPLAAATLGSVLSDMFATELRYTGISLGYQIGAALAGGTAPLIGTWLLARAGWPWLAAYLAAASAISAIAVLLSTRATRR